MKIKVPETEPRTVEYIYCNGAAFERIMKYWINLGRRIERDKRKRKKIMTNDVKMPDDLKKLLIEYTDQKRDAIERFLGAAELCGYKFYRAPLAQDPACLVEIAEAARGLAYGTDWNFGTHAEIYRPRLLEALQRWREMKGEK